MVVLKGALKVEKNIDKSMKKLISGFSGVLAAALPVLALAQSQPPQTLTSAQAVQQFICTTVIGWMFTFLIILAIVFILIAAYKYLTAAGDPEKVKSASHTLIYAAIAVAVALLARGIPLIIGTLLNSNANVGC